MGRHRTYENLKNILKKIFGGKFKMGMFRKGVLLSSSFGMGIVGMGVD